jgi:hypothetical protein
MASSYSTDLKLELMVTGENAGTWGDKTNSNLNLIQQAIAGYETINVGASDVTLVMSNATLSNARNMILNLSGSLTGARQVLVPDGIEKFYIVRDQTTRNGNSLTIKTVSGSGFAIETSGQLVACYSDGTNIVEISLNTLTGTIATAQIDNLAITDAKLASFAVTSARVASFAVTANKLATNAVTAVKIAQSTITQAKLAANSVGSDQLISTAVTAGSYTVASITVDADGRITAASSGVAGGGAFQPKLFVTTVSPGTYTKTPGTNLVGMWLGSGGGGGGGGGLNGLGGTGGPGAYGWFSQAIPGNTAPYSIGAGGNAGPSGGVNGNGSPGGTGGSSAFGNTTFPGGNGGVGGPRNSPGAPGNAGNNSSFYFAPPANQKGLGSAAGSGQFSGGGGGGIAQCSPGVGSVGSPGFIFLWENTGV